MANNILSEKKKALIARKDKLLQEIQYYEKRISDFHANKHAGSYFEENDSSDSDTELPVYNYYGPSSTQLRLQQSSLKTSLQATQELTKLQVLESQVNFMVQDPVVVDEPQVRSEGMWREVIAKCRWDLISFTINFHVHTPSLKFGAPSYRNLKVSLFKAALEAELAKSVLAHTTTPSEAVEVIRSYATAHRSRRSTMAHLADKYTNLLFMEPLPEGGYILKCAGLLEVCWTLQNKWSPIAAFRHRMIFQLEYMDESYIKTITQYYRQLSDPSLETEERTALLCKIINTCLDARGPTQELYESMESDPETAQTLRKRRTTLEQEVTETVPKKKRDGDIMAPPKSLPKRSKAKGKENVDGAKSDRRSDVSKNSGKSASVVDRKVTNDNVKSKKGKNYKKNESDGRVDTHKENFDGKKGTKEKEKGVVSTKDGKEVTEESADAGKNVIDKPKADNRKDVAKDNTGTASDNTKTSKLNDKDTKNAANDKNIDDEKKNTGKVIKKRVIPKDNVNTVKSQKVAKNSDQNGKESTSKSKVITNSNKNTEDNNLNDKIVKPVPKKNKKTDDIAGVPAKKAKIDKTTTNAKESNVKTAEKPKKSINNVNKPQNIGKNLPKDGNSKNADNTNAKNQNDFRKKDPTFTKTSETVQKVAEKNKIVSTKVHLSNNNNAKIKDDITKNSKASKNNAQKVKSDIENNKNVINETNPKSKVITGNIQVNSVKKLSAGNTAKETSTDSKVSKIPQKLTKVPSSLKKNPLRISPRKMSSNLKSAQGIAKTIQMPVTSIPRLLKKPVVK